jgi:hypothetical protein
MRYAILCYNNEAVTSAWTKEEDDAVMARLDVVHKRYIGERKMGPQIRLLPTTTATTLRKADDMVLDGPYAETKEQLLGFYIVDCANTDEALELARDLARANPGGAYEIRPISLFFAGGFAGDPR